MILWRKVELLRFAGVEARTVAIWNPTKHFFILALVLPTGVSGEIMFGTRTINSLNCFSSGFSFSPVP